jgi:mitosis inhibitor protein kinase SWE1
MPVSSPKSSWGRRRDENTSPAFRTPLSTLTSQFSATRHVQSRYSQDDFFLQSPFQSPPDSRRKVETDYSHSKHSIFSIPSTKPVLLTPLSIEHHNLSPGSVTVGMKRKSTPNTTPLRSHGLTPLKIVQKSRGNSSGALDRLAPPDLSSRTPNSHSGSKPQLGKQTASLKKLMITDLSHSENDDSGCEMDEGDLDSRPGSPLDRPSLPRLHSAGDVAASVSPGGHISKRRAGSRPISRELIETMETVSQFCLLSILF